MEVLQICVSVSVIVATLGSLAVFAIVRPLNQSNKDLRDMIKELRGLINELRIDIKATSGRLNRLEGEVHELKYGMQKAHDRLDALPKEAAAHERLGH
ncbi:MAG: hypothetical protein IJ774_02010 [Selenomonadaceae bacterium]|nr:hypothetical protein [Selenomonadaceae bacterium]MBR1805140.1 hypothetical protein [Selenomonadaceae bacterium]